MLENGGPPADVDELAIMRAVDAPNPWLANSALYGIANSDELTVSLRAAFRGCPVHVELVTVDTWRQEVHGHVDMLGRVAGSHVVVTTPGVAVQYLPFVRPGSHVVLLQYKWYESYKN